MLGGTCSKCPLKGRCPIRRDPMLCQLRLNGQDLRLAQRRAAERTDDFKTDYRMRGGIEATNSMLKRVTGLDRLRVRGRPAVFSQHSAESRRLEFTASGQRALTDRQTDERWNGWGFCAYVSRNFLALARSHIASKRLPAFHSCLTDSNPELRQIPTLKQPTFVARVRATRRRSSIELFPCWLNRIEGQPAAGI